MTYNQKAFLNNTTVSMRWLDFVAMVDEKDIFIQYADGTMKYQIFAFDGDIAYFTDLFKAAYSSQTDYDPDYSQAQNDIDCADFETNYKANANQVISSDNRATSGTITAAGSGNGSDGSAVWISTRGAGNVGTQVSGTWSGILQFEVSIDGTNWVSTFAFPIDNANSGINLTTTNGTWRILGGGVANVRVRASSLTSGTPNVYFQTTAAASTVRAAQGASTGSPGNAWLVRNTDGTNILGTPGHPFKTDPTGTTTQPISGAVQITDNTSTVGITDVLGNKALKVDVIKTVASGGAGSGGTSSNFGDPSPVAGTAAGFTDGYLMQEARVFDLDNTSGQEYVLGVNLRTPGAGGSVDFGTNSNPIRTDPTGNTTQPVSVSSLPLPSGAATEATLALIKAKTDNLDVALSTRAITGLTDSQLRATAVPVSTSSLPLPLGASTEATLAAIKAKTDNLDVALSTRAVTGLTDTQLRATAVPVAGTFFQSTQPVSAVSLPLPTGAATAAKQDTIISNLQTLNSLVPSTYDYVSLGYTGADLTTVIYKSGGSSGTTVSTLSLTYSSGILTSVTRT